MIYSLCKVWPLASGHYRIFTSIHCSTAHTHLGFSISSHGTLDNYPQILDQKGSNVPCRHAGKKPHPHCCLEGTKPSTLEGGSLDLEGLGRCDA